MSYKFKHDESSYAKYDKSWIDAIPEKEEIFIEIMQQFYYFLLNQGKRIKDTEKDVDPVEYSRMTVLLMSYYLTEDGQKLFCDAMLDWTIQAMENQGEN